MNNQRFAESRIYYSVHPAAMSTVLPPSIADFCGVISESKRIINAHSRHFLALSVLFLLPLSFSLAVFPILFSSSSSSIYSHVSVHALRRISASFPPLHHHRLHLHISLETLTFVLLFATFSFLLSLAAASTVTFSVFHGFYGRPVKLGSALTSLSRSFLRLLATSAAALISFSFVVAAFAFFKFVAWKGFELIAGADRTPLDSVWFLAISYVGTLIFAFAFAFTGLSVNWILMSAVVVIESRWGFDGLFRSKKLVSGMRWTGLYLIYFFWLTSGLLLCISWISSSDAGNGGGDSDVVFSPTGDWWRNWAFVVQIVVTSAILTVILLHGIAAAAVFYMYCKAVRGELADEIAKEFAAEYVSLPFDDEKVPHLVSVINH